MGNLSTATMHGAQLHPLLQSNTVGYDGPLEVQVSDVTVDIAHWIHYHH